MESTNVARAPAKNLAWALSASLNSPFGANSTGIPPAPMAVTLSSSRILEPVGIDESKPVSGSKSTP